MLFNSAEFLLFFPVVTLIYYIIPNKTKHIWLLAASYFFYMCWNAEYALLLLTSTLITYAGGLFIEKTGSSGAEERKKSRQKKAALFLCVFIDLGILFVFKYTGFAAGLLQKLFSAVNADITIPEFDLILPVGISFYTFQAIGYTADVYRGKHGAEKNFLRYALFVSFFPQLVAGPIERSGALLDQLREPKKYDHDSVREGLFTMLWGFFLKTVIADRAAVLVDTIYGSFLGYSGSLLLAATFLFGIQIYCDFAGYSTIAVGAAKILGIKLTDNFDAPYLSSSAASFWNRWHISLTSWFRDYVYIPLGGGKKGTPRKCLNIMIVFLLSGLWHGADISFVIWGGINGVLRIADELTDAVKKKPSDPRPVKRTPVFRTVPRGITAFIAVNLTWVFFRAPDVSTAGEIFSAIFSRFNAGDLINGALLKCGLDKNELFLLAACVVVLLICDIFKRNGLSLPEKISGLPFPFRCLTLTAAVCAVLLFGKWSMEADPGSFIYFRF